MDRTSNAKEEIDRALGLVAGSAESRAMRSRNRAAASLLGVMTRIESGFTVCSSWPTNRLRELVFPERGEPTTRVEWLGFGVGT